MYVLQRRQGHFLVSMAVTKTVMRFFYVDLLLQKPPCLMVFGKICSHQKLFLMLFHESD